MGFLKSYFAPGKVVDGEQEEKKKGRRGGQANKTNKTDKTNKTRGDKGAAVPEGLVETSMSNLTPAGKMAPYRSKETALILPPPNSDGVSAPRSPLGSRPSSTHSRRSSLYPAGDFRNKRESVLDVKSDVMCSWLHQQQLERQYTTGMLPAEGAVLKRAKDNYSCCPAHLRDMPDSLYEMAMQLNVRCAITVNTRVINVILAARRTSHDYMPLPDGLRLQVLPSMRQLPTCHKHHFAAFIQDQKMLVVWDDDPRKVLDRADMLERQLMKMIWGTGGDDEDGLAEEDRTEGGEKQMGAAVSAVDLEAALEAEVRSHKLTNPVIVGLTLALCISCTGLGLRNLALEVATDGSYLRLLLAVFIPAQIFVGLFFFQALVGNLFQIFGPISSLLENSKFYSGKPPRRLDRESHTLPHVTIQMPVYKEGLGAVIRPTVQSLKQAMSTYEMQGGSANILVNDDGMQLLADDEAQARREFYEENNIGWVARPKHEPNPADGGRPFLRRGKFKKASNMNYAMMVSNRVEERLLDVARPPGWTQAEEKAAYEQCLADILDQDDGRTWAQGNIRIGDYILLIDSDTRVPVDCLLDDVSEMEQSPDVAILQHTSGVMRVTTSFFEGAVTWFTNLIYTSITFGVSNGDACPFVGHNAMLRWSAIQDAASYQDEDGYEKFWSESHVSEDFDMSLRLQCAGYILRYVSYTGADFQEGVSLTVYDELARWEKYAYGCNELMFHPLRFWPTRGPITPLFRAFICSGIHLPKKLTICAYIGTYYAIGASWALTIMNYFLTGWYFGLYDKFYLDSFAIYVSIVVCFTGLGNVALSVLRYRLNEQGLFAAFWTNMKWIPLMTIFLGGISLHVSQALLCHFLSIDMTWGATAKELERVNFVQEVPRLVRRFKGTFCFTLATAALMVAGACAFPVQWRITYLASIWPLASFTVCHFLLPVALNPALMVFAW